jgi:serine/threonine protein kinase
MDTSLLQERIGEGIRVIEVMRQNGAELLISARDLTRHVPVVLRALDLELAVTPEEVRYFEQQAAQAVGYRHLNIATAQPLQRGPNLVYYALNVGFATTLQSVLDEGSALSFEQSLDVLRGIASALDYAHSHSMVHGRLDPKLIFVDGDDVMVTGFVSLREADSLSAASATPYTSPEHGAWRYEADARADVYSMGVIAFELIAGKRLPALSSVHVTFTDPFNIARDVPLRAGVSLHVNEAILRAVAKRPSLRYATAEDFIYALETSHSKPVAEEPALDVAPAAPAPQSFAPLLPVEPERVVRPKRAPSVIGIGTLCAIGAFTLLSMRKGIDIPDVSSAIAGTLSRLTTSTVPPDSSIVMVPADSPTTHASAGVTSPERRRKATSRVGVANGEVGSSSAKAGDSLSAIRRARPPRDLASRGWMGILQTPQFRILADTGATVRQSPPVTKVWVRTEFATPQRVSDNDSRAFVSSVYHYKLNCEAGTTSVGPGAFYDAAGTPIVSISSGYAPLQRPTTGTPAEEILTRVCGALGARGR